MTTNITTDRFTGKVALVSGAGRGQGRQVAIDLAKEGADIIGFDICEDIPTASVPMSSAEDLDKTRAEVAATGRHMVAMHADVRDYAQVKAVVDRGLAEFGRLDVVVANAGIVTDTGPFWELSLRGWNDIIATNLTGVFHTAKAATPAIIAGGRGGALVLVASAGATKGFPNISNYVAAKRGVVGMIRPMAAELGPHGIRVNALSPTNVATDLFMSKTNKKLFVPHLAEPSEEEYEAACRPMHVLPAGWIETADTSAATRWLASDEARYVTGIELRVDAGVVVR
ncbi:mycofactocin-coupled SDR family oxidoreductase [Saccharopolyspora phatthalungensis]|uniref:(+)-trans-carveol dehydrogenase n=1 Tax=Saccharopolyspora phatthalungensis TaxID=664693 RepID=A0A840QFL0_9PSEU|nr:mycofactocin-coupled SDR family oxidoreductase [Saccharopolyspora phatthalungensis]MBB5159226.1 (+)-trans-carveol dehydrogenase [Saccharopolyspora phatthalungensis]